MRVSSLAITLHFCSFLTMTTAMSKPRNLHDRIPTPNSFEIKAQAEPS